MNRIVNGAGRQQRLAGWRFAAVCCLLGTLVGGGDSGVSAQATPAADSRDVPALEACTVEPRAFPLFPAGVGQREAATPAPVETPPAAPYSPPAGEVADAATVASVTSTVRESIACRNAGELLRAYALFTQDMIVELFGGPGTVDPELGRVVAEGARQVPPGRRLAIVTITDVVALADGRAGAVVVTESGRREFRDFLIFERDAESDRWLIDETVPLE